MLSTSKTDKRKDKGQSQHRSSKPLHNKRFYLDLKSHIATNNLEQKLKSLGASVEWFLVKEVNYVVTDRPNWTPGSGGSVSSSTPKCGTLTPLGGLCSIESPATLDSPGDGSRGRARRSKTRAEAMLERARLQPQQCTVDPLENATRWSIPIWPLDKVIRWLDRICEKYLKPLSPSAGTVLKNPYIKLENISAGKYRPLYKELSVWPNINLDFEIGGCPFSPPKISEKRSTPKPTKEDKDAAKSKQPKKATADTPRMTRKSRGRMHRGHETPIVLQKSGYCEICQQTFVDQRTHIVSERHVQFVSNNRNFVSLDDLIHQGPNMDAFLKLNGVNEISDCETELSGNCRRSLRSVVRLHSLTLDTNTPVKTSTNALPVNHLSSGGNRSPEEGSKMLLQQKESLEVQCNGIWSHCYGTRHGGMKSPISGNIARRVQWEIQMGGGGRPQRMRRASASYCTPSLQQQLSPTGSDSGHHLRSRGQIWLPSSLLGTTAEDEAFPSRTRLADPQPARTSRDIPVTRCDAEVKSPPCRNQTIRRKRLSVEEKLIEDNKAYYKIELKNSKLRSSGYYPSQRDLDPPVKQEVKEEKVECNGDQGHKVEEPTPAKFLRVRKSELTLLSDEAESFMFGEPTRKESSTESSEEEEEDSKNKVNKNSRKENSSEESNVKKPSDNKKGGGGNVVKLKVEGDVGIQCSVLQCDESSVGSIDTCSLASSCDTNAVVQKKRKRRTHAEAFIHDNLDYYKFEIPGSRLRFQGSILPPTPIAVESKASGRTTNNSKASKAMCNGAHSKVITCSNEASNEKEKIVQSQEESKEKTDRETESKSVKKQEKDDDKKKEEKDESNVKECVENDLCPTMEKLHFSFEVVPQSEPWFQTYTRQDEGEEFYAYAHMSDACYWKPFLLPYEMPMPETLSGTGSMVGPGPAGFVKKRRNRFAHLLDKKPRKSPRCHASTLAILSSLMHHRRRKEPDKSKEENPKSETSAGNCTEDEGASQDVPGTSSEASQASEPEVAPPPAVPNSDFKSESDTDLHEIARNVDKMFGLGSDAEEVSGSENDISGDEVKPQNKGRKSGKKNKKGSGSKTKKVESESAKQQEVLEIDPAAIEELSMEPPPIAAVDQTELRCRGGPKMDVVTLIDEFSTCHCMEETSITEKDVIYGLNPSLLLSEASCNSSECGASSTCETVNMSDGAEGRVFRIRGRRRKRKKNLTGWPAEKQRGRKKQINKVNRIDENVPTNKCENNVDKSVEDKINKKDKVENDRVVDNKKEVESVSSEKHARTESVDSSEYQPCVRVTKMPDLSSSSSYYVAGISNNRRLRSSSLSSSPPTHSVPLPRKYPSLSADGLKRRASPRKCASLQWNAWSTRRRR